MGELNLDKFERAWYPVAELRPFHAECSVDLEGVTCGCGPALQEGITKLEGRSRRTAQSSCKIEKLSRPFVLV